MFLNPATSIAVRVQEKGGLSGQTLFCDQELCLYIKSFRIDTVRAGLGFDTHPRLLKKFREHLGIQHAWVAGL